MTGFPVLFLEPLALLGLIALPAIWLLLRFTPPRPQRVTFPATRILLGLEKREETRARSPWWLTLLRILIATLIILALARPTLNPTTVTLSGTGPVALLIDDGWASATDWDRIVAMAEQVIAEADRAGRAITVQTTAAPATRDIVVPLAAREARDLVGAIEPVPYAPDRPAAVAALAAASGTSPPGDIVWLTDGLDHGAPDGALNDLLATSFAGTAVHGFTPRPGETPPVLLRPEQSAGDLVARVALPDGAQAGALQLRALDQRGRVVAEAPVTDNGGATDPAAAGQDAAAQTDIGPAARFDLPIEIRNEIARIEIAGEQSAAAVQLLDDRFQRKTVGLLSATVVDDAQPLLAPLHYITQALAPFADIEEPRGASTGAVLSDLIDNGASLIVMADIGTLSEADEALLSDWIDDGGVVLRFAGPRLAAAEDPLAPVRLRQGERTLGGALSWSEPQSLADFPETGAFAGLDVPDDIVVERQVLAEPDIDLQNKTWATLADGTPLVTAERRGNGWLVLFHVTADTAWSTLPLSGVFVDMMQRLLGLAPAPTTRSAGEAETADRPVARGGEATAMLRPIRVLDGRGASVPPPVTAQPILAADIDTVTPGPDHPPGLYGSETAFRALNLFGENADLDPLTLSGPDVAALDYPSEEPAPLAPWLFAAALILLALDSLAILFLSGLRPRFAKPAEQAMALLLAIGLVAALSSVATTPALAQSETDATAQTTEAEDLFALDATLDTRLAYVVTGNAEIDETSRLGLTGLSRALAARTSLEPGLPIGIDISSDELAFFPLLYWPIDDNLVVPDAETLARIDRYMKSGGTILFDTRDQVTGGAAWSGSVGPGMQRLRALLAGLDLPALEPVPVDHVLTKTFYLLQDFPGRFDGGPLWVEALERDPNAPPRPAYNADGVSSIMITANDLAGAWAEDATGVPLYPVVPGGENQREMARRVGINIVMYTLTGNYKADQVHIPALLERLGQ